MEEILASIRRIIADDQAAKPDEDVPAAPIPAPVPQNDDILDLAEVARPARKPEPVPPPAEPAIDFDSIAFEDAVDFADAPPEPPPRPAAPERLQAVLEEQVVERLTSRETDASVGQAFNLLATTVLTQNARTLEDLVAEMLRPMLKAWLDDNLPGMVERLVRAEIERVARGR